ncbi:MAG: twin-arginine translocation signal domain-containing protein, partial [Sedimentisphaerales bacterium]|nr:twin-arginine translocation signal domain-containing protein [Sedimentisphaerales bacterium]
MRRRDFLKAVGAGAVSLSLSGCAVSSLQSSPSRKPSFVFILIDDLGWTDLG